MFASFATLWPYNLTPSFTHYVSGLVDADVNFAEGFAVSRSQSSVVGTVMTRLGSGLAFDLRCKAAGRACRRRRNCIGISAPDR